VPAAALPALLAAAGGRKAGPLFRDRWGRRVTARDLRDYVWYPLLTRLGLARRTPHEMRHGVATHAIAAGVPIGNVARDLGDTPETIVETYLHATDGASVADAMDRLFG